MTVQAHGPVAVGVADDQPAILEYAAREAVRAGCALRLIRTYAVPPAPMVPLAGVDIPASYRAGAQDVLDAAVTYVEQHHAGLEVETVLERAHTPTVLERESHTSRLMVIGPAARKPWYVKMFEGEVTHHLAERSECPVVVVPRGWLEPQPDAPIIVVFEGEAAVFEHACETAAARNAPLRILAATALNEDVLTPLRDRFPQVVMSQELLTGEPRAAALRAAEHAALLVLARPDEHRLPLGLVDKLGQDIVAAANCPVVVVPVD